jgi:hypothetical protein
MNAERVHVCTVSTRKVKEDEKQKEMKACQRAAGPKRLICNSKEKGVGQLQQEAESA